MWKAELHLAQLEYGSNTQSLPVEKYQIVSKEQMRNAATKLRKKRKAADVTKRKAADVTKRKAEAQAADATERKAEAAAKRKNEKQEKGCSKILKKMCENETDKLYYDTYCIKCERKFKDGASPTMDTDPCENATNRRSCNAKSVVNEQANENDPAKLAKLRKCYYNYKTRSCMSLDKNKREKVTWEQGFPDEKVVEDRCENATNRRSCNAKSVVNEQANENDPAKPAMLRKCYYNEDRTPKCMPLEENKRIEATELVGFPD